MTVRRTPARGSHGQRLDEPTLVQFVVLSMLLHILAIVLFGATGRSGAGRGEELLESLDVTLRPLAPAASLLRTTPREAAPPPAPAAPRRGQTSERRPAGSSEPAPSEPERFELATPPEETPSPEERLLRPNPSVPEDSESASHPATEQPPRIETTPERLEPVVPAPIERELAQPIQAPRALSPVAPSPSLERLVPPAVERTLAKPLELPREATPAAPAAPIERLAPSTAERELASPVAPLPEKPLAPEAPIERMVAPRVEHELAPPIEAPARPLPSSPAAPIEPVGPRPRPSVPSAAPPVAPTAPGALPAPRLGAPHPDEDIFKPREPTPSLDLEAAKKRAVREMAREGSGSPGVLPFPLPVPETKTREAKAMEKAIKPDCRTAYSGMGLLAVPVLIAATITDEGCRW